MESLFVLKSHITSIVYLWYLNLIDVLRTRNSIEVVVSSFLLTTTIIVELEQNNMVGFFRLRFC